MGLLICEEHIIQILPDDLSLVNEHMRQPKDCLPPLPVAVLSQIGAITARIASAIVQLSGGDEAEENKMAIILEPITNAVSHGNQSDVSRQVRVKIKACLFNNVVCFTVEIIDQGTQTFSVSDEISEAIDPENLERENGRGLFLTRDWAKFTIDGPKYNPSGKSLVFSRTFPLHSEHSSYSKKMCNS